jgi:hypothetical protein
MMGYFGSELGCIYLRNCPNIYELFYEINRLDLSVRRNNIYY